MSDGTPGSKAGSGGKPAAVRSFVPYPESLDELLSIIREWWHNHDVVEALIRPGDKIVFVHKEAGGGQEYSRDIQPFDVLSQGELIRVDAGEESPVEVIFSLFEALVSWGKWPKAFLVNSSSVFMRWVGLSGVRLTKPVVFGVPVVEDSRIPDSVVILGATSSEDSGYGMMVYGVFAHVEALSEVESFQVGTPVPVEKALFSVIEGTKEDDK